MTIYIYIYIKIFLPWESTGTRAGRENCVEKIKGTIPALHLFERLGDDAAHCSGPGRDGCDVEKILNDEQVCNFFVTERNKTVKQEERKKRGDRNKFAQTMCASEGPDGGRTNLDPS